MEKRKNRTTERYIWNMDAGSGRTNRRPVIDLHNLTADYLDKEGQEKAAAYYNHDHTHTSKKGAELNAKMLAKGLKEANCPLAKSIKLITY